MQITVNRKGSQYQQDYIRGIAQHDLCISNAVSTSGTGIILKPEKGIFGDTAFSKKVICDWLEEQSGDIMNLEIDVYSVDK